MVRERWLAAAVGALALAALCVVPGCAESGAAAPPLVAEPGEGASGGELAARDAGTSGGAASAWAGAETALTPEVARTGPLTRDELDAALRAGLGQFLAGVELSPVLDARGFVGFRLDAARNLPAWRAAGMDLRPGDVVLRVNGVHIVRPIHALRAFELLRGATAIRLDVLRDGAPVTLVHPIADTAAHAARN